MHVQLFTIVEWLQSLKLGSIVTIRAVFQQGTELKSSFNMNTQHSNWKLMAHLCSSNGDMTLSCGVLFSVTELIKN